ncbi:MAG: hypothetical protein NVS3B24_22900 [Candidatus Dormibacteria bacterium]
MFYAAWVLGGLLLGALIRDLRRAVVLMVAAVLAVVAIVAVVGHRAYPLADSTGLLLLPLAGIVATICGHRARRFVWTRIFRRT